MRAMRTSAQLTVIACTVWVASGLRIGWPWVASGGGLEMAQKDNPLEPDLVPLTWRHGGYP